MPRMLERVAARVAVVVTIAAATLLPSPATEARPHAALALHGVKVTDANWPAAFTFAPDGRIFYGERLTGEIRIYNPATSSDTLFFTIPNVVSDGERGFLGLALHPKYATG